MDAVDVCLNKKQYRNERLARQAAGRRTKATGIYHEAYKCQVCYFWHLTSFGFVGQPSIKRPLRRDYLEQ